MKTLISAIGVTVLLGLASPTSPVYARDSRDSAKIQRETAFRKKAISTIQEGLRVYRDEILPELQNRRETLRRKLVEDEGKKKFEGFSSWGKEVEDYKKKFCGLEPRSRDFKKTEKGFEELLNRDNSFFRDYKQTEYDLERLEELIAKVRSNIRGGEESIAYNQGEISLLKK